MTNAENGARARAWIECFMGPVPFVACLAPDAVEYEPMMEACASALAAAVRAKGEMELRRIYDMRDLESGDERYGFLHVPALTSAGFILEKHLADVPEVPSCP